ncbi:zinc knuckle CX2CX4HX4C containing protein [Tanacetum coccineum]
MKDLVANKNDEIRMNPRYSTLRQNQLPPKEQDPRSFILLCSIGRLDFNNALADLGASISVMPFSMYKCLGLGKLEPINMVIEIANNMKCTPKGIVENLLVKIDKFILHVDFVILDMVEDFRMPIILGRPLLAMAHAQVHIFRKSISLEVGNEKVIFKMRSSLYVTTVESIRAIKRETRMEDNDLIKLIMIYSYTILNPGDWYDGTSEDENYLEGIIDYLEPKSYDRFIDLDDEAYKERKCKFLGMTYRKPPTILIKKVEVTRYTIDPGETYTKIKVLGIEEIPRTEDNIAKIRAGLLEEIGAEGGTQGETLPHLDSNLKTRS